MPGLLHPLRIGSVTLPNNLVLSPMAGFTDLPFRVLARRHGAGLVCSEMVAAGSVERRVARTLQRMLTTPEERPTSVQVFGTDPEDVARATREVERHCDVVGFNMGCPAWQIRNQGCGAALLDDPERSEELVRAVAGATSKPVLAKMRLGNDARADYVRFARRLEDAGADAIIVHGRTAADGYSGTSDWEAIAEIKRALGIPVIGNGDVTDGPSAERALAGSGVDGIALGRAALGDPRVFTRVAAWLERGERLPLPGPEERLQDFLAYARMAEEVGLTGVQVMQQAQQFTRGLRGGAELRRRFTGPRSTPIAEIVRAFEGHLAARA